MAQSKIFMKILEKNFTKIYVPSDAKIFCLVFMSNQNRRHITHVLSHICLSKSTFVVLLADNCYEKKEHNYKL